MTNVDEKIVKVAFKATPFEIEVEQLRLARVDEGFTRGELDKVQEERDTLLQRTAEGRHIQQKLDDLATAKDLAKATTKMRYDAVRDSALAKANALLSKGMPPWGRDLHSNVQVQKSIELHVINMGKTVEWLDLVGMGDIVSIPLHRNTGFFRNAKPPAGTFELHDAPTIKVDKDITPRNILQIPVESAAVLPPDAKPDSAVKDAADKLHAAVSLDFAKAELEAARSVGVEVVADSLLGNKPNLDPAKNLASKALVAVQSIEDDVETITDSDESPLKGKERPAKGNRI
ncbi:MAG: hypothetical protein KAS32_21290 [Candidatus Peribacteraceae bacterium]|nr:hypothetical protein [Candidatus Peribacteraceae bacterium]